MVEEQNKKKAKELIDSAIWEKDYYQAIEKFQMAAKLTPDDRQLWSFIGETYYKMGKYENAVEAYRKANEISEDGETYFWLGVINQNYLKKSSEALEMYTKAIELNPKENRKRDAWLKKGLIFDGLKNFDEALKCYEECIKIDPNYSIVYNNIGWLYDTLKNDKEKAISYYEKAIELDPRNEYARGNLASHNIIKKETAEDWNYEGDAYFKKKNYKEALKHFKKAAELKPGERLYLHNIGRAYHWLRKNKDAIKYFEKANAISPHWDTYLHMGWAYRNLKKYKNALECLKIAEKEQSYNHIVINEIGNILFKQGNFSQALGYFRRTTELKSDYALGWYNVGITYKRLGEYYVAINAWMKALSIDKNHRLTKKAFGTLLRERPYLKDDIIAVAEGKFDYLKK